MWGKLPDAEIDWLCYKAMVEIWLIWPQAIITIFHLSKGFPLISSAVFSIYDDNSGSWSCLSVEGVGELARMHCICMCPKALGLGKGGGWGEAAGLIGRKWKSSFNLANTNHPEFRSAWRKQWLAVHYIAFNWSIPGGEEKIPSKWNSRWKDASKTFSFKRDWQVYRYHRERGYRLVAGYTL